MSLATTAVLIPVHNERETIARVIERVLKAGGGRIGMLIVADDASTDGSGEIARGYTPHVVRLEENGGNGMATRAALRYVRERGDGIERVVRIDGDGQHDPGLLPGVLDRLGAGADIVVCSRFHPRSDTRHVPPDRLELNVGLARRMRQVTGWPVTDARSGFLGFRWSLLAPIVGALRTRRYGIPMELLLRVWNRCPEARYEELAHPAMYQPGISKRLDLKYRIESAADKATRRQDAHEVFEATCRMLGIRLPAQATG